MEDIFFSFSQQNIPQDNFLEFKNWHNLKEHQAVFQTKMRKMNSITVLYIKIEYLLAYVSYFTKTYYKQKQLPECYTYKKLTHRLRLHSQILHFKCRPMLSCLKHNLSNLFNNFHPADDNKFTILTLNKILS